MNLKLKIIRYLAAMNATAFDSAIHALALFCGVAGAHEATGSVPALNLQQLAWLFLIAFARAMLAYLEAHPLAALLPGEAGLGGQFGTQGTDARRGPGPSASQPTDHP